MRYVAHRGVHQTFAAAGVGPHTCTASRIAPVEHGYVENTLPSMRAAFEAGADLVEIDVHATADQQLVVLHDEVLDCRTDGHGRPEDHPLAELRELDLGYGYTADDGATFPLRGARGLVVALPEVFAAFPDGGFVVDIKAGGAEVGDLVADVLSTLSPADRARQWVYGAQAAVERVEERLPEVRTFTRAGVTRCLKGYLAGGWIGLVPASCRHSAVLVPIDKVHLLWGGARGFERRLERRGAELVLIGPLVDGVTTGIDDPATRLPRGFDGWVWTNRIERVGPRPW